MSTVPRSPAPIYTDPLTVPRASQDGVLPYTPNLGQKHYPECWRDRLHHNCAVVRGLQLEQELARLRGVLEEAVAHLRSAVVGGRGDDADIATFLARSDIEELEMTALLFRVPPSETKP